MNSGALAGVAVFDGRSEVAGATGLTWADGLITALAGTPVAPARAPSQPAGPGYSVVPGLIDTHVHLLGFAGGRTRVRGFDLATWPLVTSREEQTLHGAANAAKALQAGVTTLRDLGADDRQAALARVFDAGVLPGPRLLASGPVGMTAGHLDLFTPRTVTDRMPTADGPDACRALVRRWAREGLTGIKVYTSGGVLSAGDRIGWRQGTSAELEATVDEAHALGMRVACHTHSAAGIDLALAAGVDSLEHATGMTGAQADQIAARGVPVAPTLLINDMIARGDVPVSAEAQDKAAELLEHRDAELRRAADAGVPFVLGTDANGYFTEFGDQWAELRRMVEVLGYSPAAALTAATCRAADAVGLGAVTGTVAAGWAADLLVVRGRPWTDAQALRPENVVAVIARGRIVAGAVPAELQEEVHP